jgi:hypothetical protein
MSLLVKRRHRPSIDQSHAIDRSRAIHRRAEGGANRECSNRPAAARTVGPEAMHRLALDRGSLLDGLIAKGIKRDRVFHATSVVLDSAEASRVRGSN